jgi:hypothetical protein
MKKILAGIATLVTGFALATPLGYAAPQPTLTWILVGGHGDPTGSGIDGELFRLGWYPKGKINKVQIAYLADATKGDQSTAEGSEAILKAYNANCKTGAKCEIHAVSGGGNPAIRFANQLGLPNPNNPNFKLVLHAVPNTLTGAWHSLNNQSFLDAFDPYSASYTVKEVPRPGTEHWYNQDDYVANKAPQCFSNAALLYMAGAFNSGVHRIQPKAGAHDVWTGPDGVINHEYGAAATQLTVSGRSAVKPTCPDPWYSAAATSTSSGT